MLAVLVFFISVPLLARGAPLLSGYAAQAGLQMDSDGGALNPPSRIGLETAVDPTSSPAADNDSMASQPPAAASPVPTNQTASSTNDDSDSTALAGPLVMAYYPDWAGGSFPPENISFDRFDWIDFAFALPTADFNLTWDDPNTAPDLLRRLVAAGHSQGKKVKLSVGGWTGSKFFSGAVATDASRRTFAGNIGAVYDKFGLDGIDIDWEYPGRSGQPGNEVSSEDSMNYLAFLQVLRAALPADARISAATQSFPFSDPQGESMRDVREFAKVLDWILLMNYDVWGSSSTPGPNAPFYNGCSNSSQPEANAVSAFNAWTAAGFPASQLVLGLPSYGYISHSTATSLRTRAHGIHRKRQDAAAVSTASTNSAFRVTDEDGGSDGQVQFRGLVAEGALVRVPPTDDGGVPQFVGGQGFTRYWDECSATPFLRSPEAGQIITYDDPQSLGMKAAFAKQVGMLGVNMFDVHGDTPEWDLIDATRKGLRL
ncbi:hypothetical protein HGRIS_009481 [Hohenbuehelia grisea]|uniref:GH18 domain-containing protein n=1 Tax=Hohenbuehelia grisea TaxID=104357 RepID=A0ABR3J2P3_9AGAR